MKLTRLASRDNYRKVEEEWKYEFIYHVLSNIGIPKEILDGCFPEGGIESFTVQHKIELRHYMKQFDVTIVDDRDGGIKIFVEKERIAEWKKCVFALREDPKEVDPSNRLYVEITADIWTIFDEGNANG